MRCWYISPRHFGSYAVFSKRRSRHTSTTKAAKSLKEISEPRRPVVLAGRWEVRNANETGIQFVIAPVVAKLDKQEEEE